MKFKVEVCLLLIAMALFAVSAFFYSWQVDSQALSYSAALGGSYPYRIYAITIVGFGSVLMLVASISYSKRSKNSEHKSYRV